ncbi:MAG TPA: amidohydrolase family protein [bacterium]|nr:amidohydrolase family protein [bacterium]
MSAARSAPGETGSRPRASVIDAHVHIIVPEITRGHGGGEPWRPHVIRDGARQRIEIGGVEVRSVRHEFVHPDGVLAETAAAGSDRVVLCPFVGLLRYDADPRDALESGGIQNGALAALVRAHPDRIAGLGTVPLQDPALAARELETAVRAGLAGVEIAASVRGVYLGDDRFRPFWEAAAALRAVVFIHPTTRGFEIPAFARHHLGNAVGNPFETTITAADLVMSGVLESHPDLRIVLAHGGGAVLALRGRLRHAYEQVEAARARLRTSPDESFRHFYYDTIVHDGVLLRQLIAYAGADRVVLGSDYPFDMGVERPADQVRALDLSAEDERRVLGGTAERLVAGNAV